MANLNKSAIAKAAGVSYKTVQRKWSAMTKAAAGTGSGTVSRDFAIEWFQSSVDSRVKKSPRKLTSSAGESSHKSSGKDDMPGTLIINIGESYPTALSIDEAQKFTAIEKNKMTVGKYQRALIRRFVEELETGLNSGLIEIRNFLVNECNLTQEQSGRLNCLIEKLVSTLRNSLTD